MLTPCLVSSLAKPSPVCRLGGLGYLSELPIWRSLAAVRSCPGGELGGLGRRFPSPSPAARRSSTPLGASPDLHFLQKEETGLEGSFVNIDADLEKPRGGREV